ncbi:MAG: repressor LexA [Chlamydiae bacterium]|nr:repressor LexA [Chlamydiota bacterium]
MNGLTAKQNAILEYIKNYIEMHHYSPSLEEIKNHFAVSSLSTIHEHLVALKKKKAIDFQKGAKRSIVYKVPCPKEEQMKIPIVGNFSSGLPLELYEKQDLFYEFSKSSTRHDATYGLKIHGNGLINEGIFNQDLLIIEAKTTLQNGEVGLISLKSGPTYIKKYFEESETIKLESLNPLDFHFQERFKKEDLFIRGKLLTVIRQFEFN